MRSTSRLLVEFVPTVPPWKINQTAWTAPTSNLYKKQIHSSMEWEGVGSYHNDNRFLSPGQKGLPLKSQAQFDGQWASQYQIETLRQTGVAPEYREHSPENPFWRDIYYEWLHRNILDDSPGEEFSFIYDGARMIHEKQRVQTYVDDYEQNEIHLSNKEQTEFAKEEVRNEEFEVTFLFFLPYFIFHLEDMFYERKRIVAA